MRVDEEYRLSEYEDLGGLENRERVRLKRNRIYGNICVQKQAVSELEGIYRFIMEHPSPYVPKVYECIEDGDKLILIEEYIAGRNLEEILRVRAFDEDEATKVIKELCEALKPFHHAKPAIICRDLKAENIMLDEAGNVKIVDFDIARTYCEGKNRDTRLLGTAEYAAPEQYGYFQTDNRTDIYALGILLNYMVTRKYPVQQMVDGKLKEIVKKCTYMEPGERYQSVEELQEALRTFQVQDGLASGIAVSEEPVCGDGTVRRKESLASFLPPGFRSRTLWKMIVGALGYICISYVCFTLEIEKEGVPLTNWALILERCMIWLSQIIFVCLVWDYRGCRKSFPLLDQKNRVVRVFLYILADVLLFCVVAALCAVIEMMFL